MGRAIVQVNKGVCNPDTGKPRLNGRRYDFPSGVGAITSDVYSPPQCMCPCAAPPSCLVVSGAAVSTVKHKRDVCDVSRFVQFTKGVRVHIALFTGRVAPLKLCWVKIVFHNNYFSYIVVQLLPKSELFCIPALLIRSL